MTSRCVNYFFNQVKSDAAPFNILVQPARPPQENFKSFYGRLKDIGLLYLGSVFHWLYEFGLAVLLGIEENNRTKLVYEIKLMLKEKIALEIYEYCFGIKRTHSALS